MNGAGCEIRTRTEFPPGSFEPPVSTIPPTRPGCYQPARSLRFIARPRANFPHQARRALLADPHHRPLRPEIPRAEDVVRILHPLAVHPHASAHDQATRLGAGLAQLAVCEGHDQLPVLLSDERVGGEFISARDSTGRVAVDVRE